MSARRVRRQARKKLLVRVLRPSDPHVSCVQKPDSYCLTLRPRRLCLPFPDAVEGLSDGQPVQEYEAAVDEYEIHCLVLLD